MHSRRSLLGAVCGATAGFMLAKPAFGQVRREVIIDGYRVKVSVFKQMGQI